MSVESSVTSRLKRRTAAWWTLLIITLAIVAAWPPETGRSLAVKVLNWAVDPDDRLPVLPPQLGYGVGDDPAIVEARDAEVRRAIFADAATEAPVLVVTEGLLIYLTADDVAPLARDLREIVRARWWLSDLASPTLLKMMGRKWARRLEAGNTPFRFAPAEGTAHFAPFGWREIAWRSTWTESFRLGRTMRFARIMDLLGKLRSKQKQAESLRISGIMLLGPDRPDR